MEFFWIELPAEMTVHIVENHEKKEDYKIGSVHRQGKKKNDQNSCFNDRLQGMKGIGCPGGWIRGAMVNEMKPFEQDLIVHQSVHPIEIGIMHKEHDRENRKIIYPSHHGNVFV
jgi:hypothetical protein